MQKCLTNVYLLIAYIVWRDSTKDAVRSHRTEQQLASKSYFNIIKIALAEQQDIYSHAT